MIIEILWFADLNVFFNVCIVGYAMMILVMNFTMYLNVDISTKKDKD